MSDIVTLYKKYFNLPNATFIRIAHEDAIVAVVYQVVIPKQEPLILKICERAQDYCREVFFLQLLAQILPVARIIGTCEPRENMFGAILMECFKGNVLTRNDLNKSLVYKLGTLLAGLHNTAAAGYGDLTVLDSLSLDPRTYFISKFEENYSECEANLGNELLKKIRECFEDHIELLKNVDGPCIIHRDFRPGNIIANNGKLQGIIDWASARASFAEEDFCPLELGEWSTSSNLKQPFLAGYSDIRPVPNYAAVMPLFKLNRVMATIGFIVKRGTWQTTDSTLYKNNLQALEKILD